MIIGEKNGGRGGYTRNVKSRNPNILYDHNRKRVFFLFYFFPLISFFVTAFLECVGEGEERG